ncbi:MAG: hypothetical protein ISS47_03265 [Candidatus Omnitrophica bacterium]|nr:hypothetical protein [Candidatus Omnitrophota bacterium]
MHSHQILYEKLLELCGKIYSPEGMSIEAIKVRMDLKEIIGFAKRNRLAHYLALEYESLFKDDAECVQLYRALISEYSDYRRKIKNTIKEIRKILDEESFMVIKTFSSFPHLTSDFDILARDIDTAKRIQADKTLVIDGLPVDINTEISWGGADIASSDFVWSNIQRFNFEGINFLVPNAQLDTIIRIGHMPFETAQIKLGELLHIYKQASLFDWSVLENEAKSMDWPKTFRKMSDILDLLHCALFKTPFFKKRITPILPVYDIEFPFGLPISILAGGVIEKKAWRKIFGARFLIKDWINEWLRKNLR